MLKAIRHLDYVVLICGDLPPMRQFYEQVLGFPLHRELGPSWVELRIGASILEPPTDQVWGHRTLFFADPEHNVIEIYAEI